MYLSLLRMYYRTLYFCKSDRHSIQSNVMGIIFYIMGKSASGKDTIYKELTACYEGVLKRIVPYTTRPIRSGEKEGREYHFTDEAGFEKLRAEGRIIEERSYNTIHGLWRYFVADDEQLEDMKTDGKYLTIGVLSGFISLKEYYGSDKVIPLYIDLDDGVRLSRALQREMSQDKPRYRELCRRYLADDEDFSSDKLKAAGIDRYFENDDLSVCIAECREEIDKWI